MEGDAIKLKELLSSYFWLCREACGILVPRPGIEPAPPPQRCCILTAGPLGKFQGRQVVSLFPRAQHHNNNGQKQVQKRSRASRPELQLL